MKTEQQAQQLLPVDTIMGKPVSVTLPRRLQRQNDATNGQPEAKTSEQWAKGVIKRVPPYVGTDTIVQATGAVWAHRIEKTNNGVKSPTWAVIEFFLGNKLPETVTIGLADFRVHPYVPLPLRCANCQKYGHKAAHCGHETPV
jgi:hypothetical protein